jgi:hypothetical protein
MTPSIRLKGDASMEHETAPRRHYGPFSAEGHYKQALTKEDIKRTRNKLLTEDNTEKEEYSKAPLRTCNQHCYYV